MFKNLKQKLTLELVAVLLVIAASLTSMAASLNHSVTPQKLGNLGILQVKQSADATSTMVFMTPGTGTTTLSFETAGADQLDLYVITAASSSPTTQYRYRVERSNSLLGDWFFDAPSVSPAGATTTIVSGAFQDFLINAVATSTAGSATTNNGGAGIDVGFKGFGTTTANFMHLPTITTLNSKAIRVVFYLGNGVPGNVGISTTTNGAIWIQGVVRKQGTP